MEVISLQSGSAGNCVFVRSSETRLLFDAGISGSIANTLKLSDRSLRRTHRKVNVLAYLGERILLIETSGTDDFDYVRAFYRNNGFTEEARIREFYAEGVDKIVYRMQLPRNFE